MSRRIQALFDRLPDGPDGILVTSEVGRRYFTGMHSSAGVLLASRSGKSWFIIDFRYIEKARAVVTGSEVVMQGKLYEQLAALIEQEGIRTLGVETDYMTLSEHQLYATQLPQVSLEMDGRVSAAAQALRMRKEPSELAAIRAAQQITEEAFEHICGYIRPGMRERDIACELLDFTNRKGSERPAFDFIVVSGPNSSMPHGVPSDRQVQTGDFITFDFGCVVDGYCSDMTRTVALGSATPEMQKVYKTVLAAHLRAIEAVRPGALCREVDAAARDLITQAGYGDCFGHGTGHSLGLEIHEAPAFNMRDQTVCEEGMVLTVEPGIYLSGRFGVRIENMVLVTQNGCEELTQVPRTLRVLSVYGASEEK